MFSHFGDATVYGAGFFEVSVEKSVMDKSDSGLCRQSCLFSRTLMRRTGDQPLSVQVSFLLLGRKVSF